MRVCAERIKRVLLRNGERFTVGGEEYLGVFSLLLREEASRYGVQGVEGSTSGRIWAVFVPFDSGVPGSGTLVWGGVTMNIVTAVERSWRGSVLFRVLVALE